MAAKYQESQDDPELLSLHSEIALLDARLADLLGRVDSGESGSLWRSLKQAHAAFKVAKIAGPVEKMQDALAELEMRIDQGVYDYQAWVAIQDLWEQRRKLCETESKRLVAMRQLITQEQALLLMGAVTDIITRNVPDKHALSQIIVELQQIMTRDQVPVYAEITE